MAYCGIMRVEKRGRSAVYGLQIEANRTQGDHEHGRDFDRSDIDWNETQNNVHLVQTDNWNKELTRQIHDAGLKERKDSIVMLDGLYTASPEFFEGKSHDEVMGYFSDCLDFHVKEFCQGDRDRVINAVVHFDEATPHMQVASVPIMEDEKGLHLSAKNIMGGRSDYRARQDRFFDEVTKERGLDRGEVRDPAETKKHTTKREWQIATQDDRFEQARDRADDMEQQARDWDGEKQYQEHEARQATEQAEQAQRQAQEWQTYAQQQQALFEQERLKTEQAKKSTVEAQRALKSAQNELKQVQAEKETLERVVADRQSMDKVLKELNKAIKNANTIGDRVAHEDLDLKKPMFGKDNEVSLASVQSASWALGEELERLKPVVKALQGTEKKLTELTEHTEQHIEDRAQEIVRQTQEQLQRDAQQAEKDRREARQAKERYTELKENEESYILGTADNKAQARFDSFIKQEFEQELTGRDARLEQFADSLTMKDGRSVLDAFNEQEQERQHRLSQSWDRNR